jgi:hypothetical protein
MADNLSSDQYTFLEAACEVADRFNDYQVDEQALMNRLGWDDEKFTRTRNELEDAGYISRKGAPQLSVMGGFWIERAGIDLCPEPLEGRDTLQLRE